MIRINRIGLITAVFMIVAAMSIGSCKKDKDKVTIQDKHYSISGTLYVQEAYSGKQEMIAIANRAVFIGYYNPGGPEILDFFYSDSTDDKGNFNFYVTNIDTTYQIYSRFKYNSSSSFAPLYIGKIVIPRGENSQMKYSLITSIDTLTQNGINITTYDENSHRIGGSLVKIYTSRVAAFSDSLSFANNSNLPLITTDSLGRGFIGMLPKDTLFVSARFISGTDTFITIAEPVEGHLHSIADVRLVLRSN